MQKNIVLAINDLKGNGAERVVLNLAEELIRQGHRCTIVCFKALIELQAATGIPVLVFPMHRYRWIPRKYRGKLVSYFFDKFILDQVGKPDLVLSNLLPVDRVLCQSRLDNVFLVIHNTMSEEYELSTEAGKQRFQREALPVYPYKPCVCVSDGVLADFKKLFPQHPAAQRIYNPINVGAVKRLASEYASPYQGYIVHVGKFKRAKRHDLLIEAFARSTTTRQLVLVGQGPLRAQMEQLVTSLGVEDRVIFAGFKSNPYPIIQGASLMVLSSDYEGLPTVLLEALALDIPVVSTDCPSGPREILPASSLLPVGDIRALVDVFEMDDYTPFRSPMGKQFSAEQVARAYLALID